ncbi:MAG: thiamine pyrophosphate-dependent enzyme [Planctomycetota bacterium]|nr:thiamine pyrophosphate-dependent enzyme [Planctomycetota bacterium]
MATLKEILKRESLLAPGHRACAGCAAPTALKLALMASEDPIVLTCATGCMEVVTAIYPYTAWRCMFIHSAFENSAATISGVETAYRALKKQGKIEKKINFVAVGGDGGTYDIGLQALSGALERGHRFVYICYNNEAYMNTGIQRSGATPMYAHTTTAPAGKVILGKKQWRKDLTEIAVAHNIPYVAQASPSHYMDLFRKMEKAFSVEGSAFINILAPCPRGWRHDSSKSIEIARLAVECCYWPLYEVENGSYKITYKPKERISVSDWLFAQERFEHLKKPENAHLVQEIEKFVEKKWNLLLNREKTEE